MIKIVRYHLKTISSTNTWAKENRHLCDPAQITLVTADTQVSGRGRGSRSWVSPPLCNIYASFCFFIEAERWRECGCLTQIAALNVAEVISRVGLKPEIKWPNDLLIQGKKVGGILMEVTPVDSTYFVVLGIGLNVNMRLEDLSLVNRAATSLTVESGCQFDLEDILKQLEDRFVSDYLLFLQKGFSPFAVAYLEKVQGLLGQEIVYQQGNVQGHGLVESMTDEGFLWLRLPDGTTKLLSSGELL